MSNLLALALPSCTWLPQEKACSNESCLIVPPPHTVGGGMIVAELIGPQPSACLMANHLCNSHRMASTFLTIHLLFPLGNVWLWSQEWRLGNLTLGHSGQGAWAGLFCRAVRKEGKGREGSPPPQKWPLRMLMQHYFASWNMKPDGGNFMLPHFCRF